MTNICPTWPQPNWLIDECVYQTVDESNFQFPFRWRLHCNYALKQYLETRENGEFQMAQVFRWEKQLSAFQEWNRKASVV